MCACAKIDQAVLIRMKSMNAVYNRLQFFQSRKLTYRTGIGITFSTCNAKILIKPSKCMPKCVNLVSLTLMILPFGVFSANACT